MKTKNIMIGLIRKRKLRLNSVKLTLIANEGLHLDRFRPLTLTYRPVKDNQTTQQILRHYFSIVIKPVPVSIKDNYFNNLLTQITNNYRKTLATITSINCIERNKWINRHYLSPMSQVTSYKINRFKINRFKIDRFTQHTATSLNAFNYNLEINKSALRLLSIIRETKFERQNTLAYQDKLASNNKTTQDRLNNISKRKEINKVIHTLSLKKQLSGNKHKVTANQHSTFTYNINYINRTLVLNEENEKSQTLSKNHVYTNTKIYRSNRIKKSFNQDNKVNKNVYIRDYKVNKKSFFKTDEELYLPRHKHSSVSKNHDQIKIDTSKIEKTLPTRIGFYQPKNGTQTSNLTRQTPVNSNSVNLNKLIDIDNLTQTVMQKINKTIRIERQRKGLL